MHITHLFFRLFQFPPARGNLIEKEMRVEITKKESGSPFIKEKCQDSEKSSGCGEQNAFQKNNKKSKRTNTGLYRNTRVTYINIDI